MRTIGYARLSFRMYQKEKKDKENVEVARYFDNENFNLRAREYRHHAFSFRERENSTLTEMQVDMNMIVSFSDIVNYFYDYFTVAEIERVILMRLNLLEQLFS